MSLPASYGKLLDLSRQMQDFALRQDWDALTQCETERAALIATMPPRPVVRSAGEAMAIASCLRQVQDCDRQILDCMAPWREQVATLLGRLSGSSHRHDSIQAGPASSPTDSGAP